MTNFFIGRQPIFNRQLETFGYELLYRSNEINQAMVENGDQATTRVILNAYSEIGLGKLVGNNKAFLNISENYLHGVIPTPLQSDRLVLEIPETITINDKIFDSLVRMRDQVFQIALDDVISKDVLPLVSVTDYIKIDILKVNSESLADLVHTYKQFSIKLIAEKVETQAELDECLNLGFDYFQGFFLCKPRIAKVRAIPPNRVVILHILAELTHEDISFARLEQIISQDVSIGYKLLQLVNSALFGLNTRIKSIQHAIALLGSAQLRKWMSLFLFIDTVDKPGELIMLAMIRARMSQLLAQTAGKQKTEEFFMVGLFSVLDALYDIPMDQMLNQLPITEEAFTALSSHRGDMGKCLSCVLAYERADWENVQFMLLSSATIRSAYLEAVDWSQVTNSIFTA